MTNSSLPNINGYQLLKEWSTSGSCRWSYAQKDGQQWFVKQFMSPKYKRTEDGISPKKVEQSHVRCEAFRKTQEELYKRVKAANTGNIVPIDDFFSFKSMFYAVSERVDISSISVTDVSQMAHAQKMILLKVLTHSLNSLHKQGVVHADLKPDNILIKKTKTGYTLKLIDFDASFLESNPRRGEKICFDVRFVAPETMVACDDESVTLNRKIDIFALGLLFHLYYTGSMPAIPKDYRSTYDAVSRGVVPTIAAHIPNWLQKLIRDMLGPDPGMRPDSEQIFQALLTETYESVATSTKKGFHLPPKLPTK